MAPSAVDIQESASYPTGVDFLKSVGHEVDEAIEKLSNRLQVAIQHIYKNPELALQEFIAHDTLCDFLEEQGFSVTRKAYGVETAFEVLSGEGGKLISINAEYDALPEVGHACGHHLIAAASVAAFLGVHFTLKRRGIPGRVQLLGTPAEENLAGKGILIKAGAFKGVDVALMSHPVPAEHNTHSASATGLGGVNFLADERLTVEFFGKATHASAYPWLGINAFDAAVSAHSNIGLLRQQIRPVERVHGCLLEGPKAANVVAPYTKLFYITRSDTRSNAKKLANKVLACFEGAAVATGCEIKVTRGLGYEDMVNNKVLCERYAAIGNAMPDQKIEVINNEPGLGSTDFGNVSHVVPGLHSFFTIDSPHGTSCHHQTFTAASGTEEAYRKALTTGGLLARLALDLLTNSKLLAAVTREWKENMMALEGEGDV